MSMEGCAKLPVPLSSLVPASVAAAQSHSDVTPLVLPLIELVYLRFVARPRQCDRQLRRVAPASRRFHSQGAKSAGVVVGHSRL